MGLLVGGGIPKALRIAQTPSQMLVIARGIRAQLAHDVLQVNDDAVREAADKVMREVKGVLAGEAFTDDVRAESNGVTTFKGHDPEALRGYLKGYLAEIGQRITGKNGRPYTTMLPYPVPMEKFAERAPAGIYVVSRRTDGAVIAFTATSTRAIQVSDAYARIGISGLKAERVNAGAPSGSPSAPTSASGTAASAKAPRMPAPPPEEIPEEVIAAFPGADVPEDYDEQVRRAPRGKIAICCMFCGIVWNKKGMQTCPNCGFDETQTYWENEREEVQRQFNARKHLLPNLPKPAKAAKK
jgi:hypothetical protein